MFESRQMKEFPSHKFAFNTVCLFLLIAGVSVWIVHHFGHQSTCYSTSSNKITVQPAIVGQYCQNASFKRDRYFFLLEAAILCVLQWAWYKISRKFTGVDALMRLFYEFATRRMHDLNNVKSRLQETGSLMNTVKITFVQLLGKTPENSLMKVILRAYESERIAPIIYTVKTILQFGVSVTFLIFSCLYLYNMRDDVYQCDASVLKASNVECITPFAYYEKILHCTNIAILLYFLLILLGILSWLIRELCLPLPEFNTTFFSLDLWLSNVDLRRNLGGVAVVEVYGHAKPSSPAANEKI